MFLYFALQTAPVTPIGAYVSRMNTIDALIITYTIWGFLIIFIVLFIV